MYDLCSAATPAAAPAGSSITITPVATVLISALVSAVIASYIAHRNARYSLRARQSDACLRFVEATLENFYRRAALIPKLWAARGVPTERNDLDVRLDTLELDLAATLTASRLVMSEDLHRYVYKAHMELRIARGDALRRGARHGPDLSAYQGWLTRIFTQAETDIDLKMLYPDTPRDLQRLHRIDRAVVLTRKRFSSFRTRMRVRWRRLRKRSV